MPDFVESLGLPLFAHRLRRLSESLVEAARRWLPQMGVTAPPKAGSTLLLLAEEGPLSVTEIATRLRLTHPLIIKLTRELVELGLVRIEQDARDGRRRPVSLTPAGRREAALLADVNRRLAIVYGQIFEKAGVDGFAAIVAIERVLADRDFLQHLAETPAVPTDSPR
jgi:DNA-binding MarR family transcriptional regulator